MSQPSDAYASDEDVALVATGDFPLLCPADQVIAAGSDGQLATSDRRTLTSATVDFAASGLGPGNVIRLVRPTDPFRPPGAMFGVSAAVGASLTLRRLGLSEGLGAPVAPEAGLTGVEFVASTFSPQILEAGREIDRLLGIGPSTPGRRAVDLAGPEAVRDATVLLVLARRYLLLSREGGPGPFLAKSLALRAEFDGLIARISLRGGMASTSPRFGTRVVR